MESTSGSNTNQQIKNIICTITQYILETKKTVPYGLLIRCRSICTEDHYFEEAAKKYTTNLNTGSTQLIF